MSKTIKVEFTPEELRVIVSVLEHNPKHAYTVAGKKSPPAGGNAEHATQARLTDRLTLAMLKGEAEAVCS